MTEMVHAFGDVSVLCRDMMLYDDIVPHITAATLQIKDIETAQLNTFSTYKVISKQHSRIRLQHK